MAKVPSLSDLEGAFHGVESNMVKDKAGNARISMGDNLMPKPMTAPAGVPAMGKKPQTPAQHSAVEKAAGASVAKRRGGRPMFGKTPF